MGFHLPSFLIGSSVSACGFLLIHRELSHRHRLTTKWALQEYAEKEFKEWRKKSFDSISDASKNMAQLPDPNEATTAFVSNWNKGISTVRGILRQSKE